MAACGKAGHRYPHYQLGAEVPRPNQKHVTNTMITTNETPVNSAINEDDVVAFLSTLQKQAIETTAPARAKVGVDAPAVMVHAGHKNPWHVNAYSDRWESVAGAGKTFAEALAAFEEKILGQSTAAKLRAEAAALLAKAEQIESEVAK
jgi:hypothetical protein